MNSVTNDLLPVGQSVDPREYMITRKRKKYRFALFHNSPICFEQNEWERSFKPNVVELGAGTGLFSVALAARELNVKFVAVDVKADRLQKGAYQATVQGLDNIRFVRSRADLVEEIFSPHSVEKLWITFPDPFPKKRTAARRLTHARFLQRYARLLAIDGALYFKTDAHDLFTWSLEQLVAGGWQIVELSFDLHDSRLLDDYKVYTTYEEKFVREGLKIHFVKALPPKE